MSLSLFADRVPVETARKAAVNFLHNNGAKASQLTDLSKEAGFPNLYIFNADEGFVVMSADDCVQPILGYSLTGRFVTKDMPENISSWLQGYNDGIQYAIDHQTKASTETAKQWKDLENGNPNMAKAVSVVEPLIQTKWNQGAPYNNLCPSGTVTGCVATAMAQVMNYWNYPSHGIGSHTYIPVNNTALGEQFADFNATYYDWANMTNTYSGSSNSIEKQAVATLMYHCGVSVDMKYGPSSTGGSGASTADVATALQYYFNYSSDAQFLQRDDYVDDWIDMLKAELNLNRPIQYSGHGSGGGHSFICDGYDSDNYFHFNWGWSGNCDAYYSMDNLNPGPGGIGSGAYGVYNDSQGAIFGVHPSECTINEPTDLTYSQSGRTVTFNWTAANGAVSYNIYRNGQHVGNTTTTSYTETAPFGTTVYYIRSVDSNGKLSLSSDAATVMVEYPTPVVNDLVANLSGNTVSLSWTAPQWCFPETESAILTYGDGILKNSSGYNGTANMYWGHRYLPSDLTGTSDKVIYKVSFFVREPGGYELKIYKGTTTKQYSSPDASYDVPTTLLANKAITITQKGWSNIVLDEPIAIDDSQDLWVIMYDPEAKNFPATYCQFNEHNRGSYLSTNISAWSLTDDGCAFLIRTYLTDGTYTYNLYDGTTKLNSTAITNTTFTHESPATNTTHQYTVKTNYYGGETAASNIAGITFGATSLGTLNLSANDAMMVTRGSTLTVTGAITNTDPANLIIEDGAQLIHPNSAVQATLQKTIEAYSTEPGVNNGWYTIASPVNALSVDLATTGSYDLYAYDEEGVYWRNQKNSANNITNFTEGTGFLYANATQQSLAFAGNMKATNTQVTMPLSYQSSNADLKGFNLVGNPFTRNLNAGDITLGGTALTTYYVVEGGSELVPRFLAETPIKPGQGFLVQASTTGQDLVFNPSSKDQAEAKPTYLCIEVSDDNFTDCAYLQFGQGNTLHKMTLSDNTTTLSVRHNKVDYAVANVSTDEDELPLNFKATRNGTYTFNINIVNVDLDYLHLIDNLTGADINLLQTPSYSFEAKTSDYESRFRLVFNEKIVNNPDNDFDFSSGNIQILDVNGRIVATDLNDKLAPGVYILKNTDNQKTKKIIINK